MKQSTAFLIIASIFILIHGCKEEFNFSEENDLSDVKFDTLTFTHSLKGWEIYSWPEDSKWKYSFLPGTNRLKTLNEIQNNPISVTGADSLKAIIAKLPAYEQIFWIGTQWLSRSWTYSFGTIQLPPKSVQVEIKEFCGTRNIILTIVD